MHAASSYSGRIGLVTFIECHFKLPPVSFVVCNRPTLVRSRANSVYSQRIRSNALYCLRLVFS